MCRLPACSALGVLLAWLMAASLAGCGDGDDGPLPSGGVFESQLDDGQALTFDHTAVYRLEAAGDYEGDSGQEEGVDEIPYAIDEPIDLTLEVGEDLPEPITLILVNDASGLEIARVEPGDGGTVVPVEPGRYVLELHHPHAGDAAAEDLTIFVVPERPAATQRERARGGGMGTPLAKFTAGKDCIGCNLQNIQVNFANIGTANLSEADFTLGRLTAVTFRATTLVRTIFDRAFLNAVKFFNATAFDAQFKGTIFTNLCCFQDFANIGAPGSLGRANFSNASISGTCLFSSDMNDATFANAGFGANTLISGSNFAGADLSRTTFRNGARVSIATDCSYFGTSCSSLGAAAQVPARFVGAKLSDGQNGVKFTNIDLAHVDFTETDMRGATFTGSTIDETTIFDGTNLSGNSFDGVNLSRADFSGATISENTSFAGATLSDGTARGINLAGKHFAARTTQFKGVDLSFANLSNTTLNEADFEGATLNGADLVGANLDFANLHGVHMRGARLGIAPGSGFTSTKLRGAYMTDVDLTDADLRSADLSSAHLYGDTTVTQLVRVRLDSAALVGAVLSGAVISGSLTNAVLDNAQLVNVVFNGADLTNAKLDNAYLQGASFASATSVAGVTLSNAAVSLMPGTWSFMEGDGTPFTLQYGATNLGAIATSMNVVCPDGGNGPCNTPDRLRPVMNGPFPPQPACVPKAPKFDNCLPPKPTS